MKSLLCCYFPTKVIFVDDNTFFLESMEGVLDGSLASCDFFDNPDAALEVINNTQNLDFLTADYSLKEIKIPEIYRVVYNPQRHEEISTVIVDYEMPRMKGLEFFEKIKNPHIRKILYTGIASEELAIQAFNDGLIDGYIRKNDPTPTKTINKFVSESQYKYFKSLTDASLEAILREYSNDNPGETAFYDPVFIEYFNKLVKEHNICEYYLNESSGSFVFLTANGKTSALFTYPEEIFERVHLDFQSALEDAAASKRQISPSLIKDLEGNRKMICLPICGDEMHPDPEEWERYAYPVEVIQGKYPYYVAYAPDAEYIEQSKIVSFNQYMRNQ